MASSWELLDEKAEAELHKLRLLNVEEKPFKRITKRLAAISSVVSTSTTTTQDSASSQNGDGSASAAPRDSVKEDLTLDFAAFDSSIARLQFLHEANERERERYAADQKRILAECRAVRTNNGQLRVQLDAARATLARRKKFDELAERITSNRLLRPREDQLANLSKLEDECRDLERESETYKETWQERRDQFNRIMEEGMMLRRQIRDEKEEVDRREGMNEEGEDDADPDRDGTTPRLAASEIATPRPDGEAQDKPEGEEEDNNNPDLADTGTLAAGTPAPVRDVRSAHRLARSAASAPRTAGQHLQASSGASRSNQNYQRSADVDMENQEEVEEPGRDENMGGDEMEVDE
ncbi:uncharacterized protein UV8b_01912 [Ustilaginoidea virens]|nr:uncharacterized protein UV8b_01912 [Ustilaginoidea virens]QUC17671.1 hypothetical protein UV8b_01912 [Ustilaginoidea virens]